MRFLGRKCGFIFYVTENVEALRHPANRCAPIAEYKRFCHEEQLHPVQWMPR
jgi:hypothetical protein